MTHDRGRRSVLRLAGTVAGGSALLSSGRATGYRQSAEPVPMGSILPLSGVLRTYGTGMEDAVNLAVSHVNAGGGPLGRPIEMFNEDSGSEPGRATDRYESLVRNHEVVGFVGAASSSASLVLVDRAVDDRVMQVSPASTSLQLGPAGYNEGGDIKYFGRTAPNDVQQARVMGRVLDTHLNAETAAFLYVEDAYGEGLAERARDSFGGETLRTVPYSPTTSDYTPVLDELFRGAPDAIGFVGYPQSSRSVLRTWNDGDYGGRWVLSESLNSPDFFGSIPDIVEGMYLTAPAPETTAGTETFREELGYEPTLFSANAYDALFLVALAVHRAGEASGTAIARNLRQVSRGPGATVTVNEFRRARELLDGGSEVNYLGASGAVDLNENLEPITRFEVLRIRDGRAETVEQVSRSFFTGGTPTPSSKPSPSEPPTRAPATEPEPPDTATPTAGPEPTPTPTTTPGPPDDGEELGPIQLSAAGLVGLVIGFLTGNAESSEITKTALTLLAVLFGGGGLLGVIRSGPEVSFLVAVGAGAILLGILLGILLRDRGVTMAPSTGPEEPSD